MPSLLVRGLLGSILILVGGAIITPVAAGAGRDLFGELNTYGGTFLGRMAGLTLSVLGLGLVSWAWLSLLQWLAQHEGELRERLRRVWILAAVWSAPLLIAPPLYSRDGWSYAAQGVQTQLGMSPYEYGPAVLGGGSIVERVDPRWMHTPAPYGPIPLEWGALGGLMTHDPYLLVIWHRLAAVAGVVLLAWAVPRLAGWTGRDPAIASAVVIAGPLSLAHAIGGLHNDVLAAGIAAVALAIAVERPYVAAVLAGLAAAVKLPAGLACIGIALLAAGPGARLGRRIASFAIAAVISLAALAAAGIPYGLGVGWLNGLSVPGVIRSHLSAPTQFGRLIEAIGRGFGSEWEWALPVARAIGMAVLAGILIWVALKTRTGDHASALRAVALTTLATFFMLPAVHLWYALWVIPFLAAMLLTDRWYLALVSFTLIAGLTAPLSSSLRGAYVSITVTTVLILGTIAPLLWRYWGLKASHRLHPNEHVEPVQAPREWTSPRRRKPASTAQATKD